MKDVVRLFTLYAKEDEGLVDEFSVHLNRLRRNGTIAKFSDKEISRTDTWDDETRSAFESSSHLLFIVSPALLNSGYLLDEEIHMAICAAERNQLTIVPILLRPCDRAGSPLSQFSTLPSNELAVVSYQWGSRQKAWNFIAEELVAILNGEVPIKPIQKSFAVEQATASKRRREKIPYAAPLAICLVALSAMAGVTYQVSSHDLPSPLPPQKEKIEKIHPKKSVQRSASTKQVADDTVQDYSFEDELVIPVESLARKIAASRDRHSSIKKEAEAVAEDQPFKNDLPVIMPSKPVMVSNTELSEMLFDYSQSRISEATVASYLCNGEETMVILGRKSMTFRQMCNELQQIKSRKIKKVTVHSTEYGESCISTFSVTIRKKGLINF